MNKIITVAFMAFLIGCLAPSPGFSAYHHEGEADAPKFLTAYPEKANTKLDNCALCHTGGKYEKNTYGSCQYCHAITDYGVNTGQGDATLNQYGRDFRNNGRNVAAFKTIETLDSDSDGYDNLTEINANRYPGSASDDPTKVIASARVYTKAQLKALPQHTQFLLMNTARSGDFYAEYTGVPIKTLLDDAGINLATATDILVFAPDGYSYTYPLYYVEDATGTFNYHVYGNWPEQDYQYPPSAFYRTTESEGWCEYTAASCVGRSNGDSIFVDGGLMAILALEREGVDLDTGHLTAENKLDGEGPFRIVPPQKIPGPPDQSSKNSNSNLMWPYDSNWDHNAGSSCRTATIIKVEPLPEGTTDIDILEAGWSYVDQGKIVIYGNINDADSNGNGIFDAEEVADSSDFDEDGTPDYMDTDTAKPRHANGLEQIILHTSDGDFAAVACLGDSDPTISQTNKPSDAIPYGTTQFKITGLTAGETVTLTIVFPDAVPTYSSFYKITSSGWTSIPFGSNDGDATITLTLTDGDAATDSDGVADGTITDPFALAVPSSAPVDDSGSGSGGSSGLCFVTTAVSTQNTGATLILVLGLIAAALGARRIVKD